MQKTAILSLGLAFAAGSALAQDATPSFTAAPVAVEATVLPALKELDPVGPGAQPAWTTAQRFSFSDVYVRPEGMRTVGVSMLSDAGFNSKFKPHAASEGAETFEVGLAHGWQVGVSFLQVGTAENFSDMELGGRIEIRKAIAPWGEIWGNPTLVGSYSEREEDKDTGTVGVLLGGNINDRLTWSGNLRAVHNFDFGGMNMLEGSGGVQYSVVDNYLAVGVEAVADITRINYRKAGGGEDKSNSGYLGAGPSIYWRPVIAGHALNVRAAALLLNAHDGGRLAPRDHISVGVSYNF